MISFNEYDADVLIIGGGLAGISAAIKAAEKGAKVIISIADKIFSGSSFSPYTWGLGIVAPFNKLDKKDFVENIYRVGCGLVDKELSYVLINNIENRIKDLEKLGIEFKKPENTRNDDTLIPCFDNKHRKWYGFTFENSKHIFYNKLKELNITILEYCKIVQLFINNGFFYGALGINQNNDMVFFSASALVIATGGFGGLYKHNLNTEDINGEGLILALSVGCELINLEFLQFIPGYLKPKYKTVFAEKSFKYVTLEDSEGSNIIKKYFPECIHEEEIMTERSTHGPFSSRIASKYVDIAIYKESLCDKFNHGAKVKYDISISNDKGFMIKEYFNWLEKTRGIKYDEEIIITTFAHASNGGIRINKNAETNVKGIYAAGEVTGGMHGADRIGGLSTANALVYGNIAGYNAASFAKNHKNYISKDIIKKEITSYISNIKVPKYNPNFISNKIKNLMWENANVLRNDRNLKYAINEIEKLSIFTKHEIKFDNLQKTNLTNIIKAQNYIKLSLLLLNTMLLRKESRGSHYREDYPNQRDEFNKFIIVSQNENAIIEYKTASPKT